MKVRLGDIAPIKQGHAKSNSKTVWLLNLDMVESETGNIIEYQFVSPDKIAASTCQFDTENVLFSKLRPYLNKVVLPDREGFATSEMLPLKPDKSKLSREYLTYYLRSPSFVAYISDKVAGAKMPRARKDDLLNAKLSLPSLSRQAVIVKTFDLVINLISLRKQQLAKLEDLVKSRFIEMFGSCATCYESWPLVKIEDISERMRTGPFGSSLLHSEFVDSGVFVLGIDNAVENHFSYNRIRYITYEKYNQLRQYTVYPGDVIITIMGTVGRSAVIPDNFPLAINTKHLACITLNKNTAEPDFICYAFQQHPFLLAQLSSQSKGAVMDGLNLTIIKNLRIHLPPLDLQYSFVKLHKQIDKSKFEIQKSLEKIEMLKAALMQQYFEWGEKNV